MSVPWLSARSPALTRSELITELASSNPHLRQGEIELIVATIFDRITDALARGDRVEVRAAGSAPATGGSESVQTQYALPGNAGFAGPRPPEWTPFGGPIRPRRERRRRTLD